MAVHLERHIASAFVLLVWADLLTGTCHSYKFKLQLRYLAD